MRRVRLRAARWVAELHAREFDDRLKARIERWAAKDPRHAAALSEALDAWRSTGRIPPELPPRTWRTGPGARLGLWGYAAAASIAALSAAVFLAKDGGLATGPGEHKRVVLADGTDVSLNANTRLLVQFDERLRRVTLRSGEALFDVARNPSRPFVVVIGDRKVVAMGTSFLIRRETSAAPAFAVTLVDGRAAVEPLAWPDSVPNEKAAGAYVLSPGERLRFDDRGEPRVDKPSLSRLTAWRQGRLEFDDVSLTDAVAEFNRYGSRRLVVDSATAGRRRVGGVFNLDDPSSFAQAMASAHRLRIIDRHGDIVLTDHPGDAP